MAFNIKKDAKTYVQKLTVQVLRKMGDDFRSKPIKNRSHKGDDVHSVVGTIMPDPDAGDGTAMLKLLLPTGETVLQDKANVTCNFELPENWVEQLNEQDGNAWVITLYAEVTQTGDAGILEGNIYARTDFEKDINAAPAPQVSSVMSADEAEDATRVSREKNIQAKTKSAQSWKERREAGRQDRINASREDHAKYLESKAAKAASGTQVMEKNDEEVPVTHGTVEEPVEN
jgi:hypothetical protein